MFWNDILLVTEQIEKYGFRPPMIDLGGIPRPAIADYDLTIATGDQQARYVRLTQRPFDHIDPNYLILNPEKGDPLIEEMPYTYHNAFGTATCLNVLEHVENPFRVFSAFNQIMANNCLLIIGTVFSFPYHPSPKDYWRFSPDCLRYLAENSGFQVLENGWGMTITGDKGVLNVQNSELSEIRCVYITLTKGQFTISPSAKYTLPKRESQNAEANRLLALQQK